MARDDSRESRAPFSRTEWFRMTALGLAVGVAALALYAWTAQRGISWQDSGEYQYKFLAKAYDWEVGAGIARLHPTYVLITRGLAACLPFVSVPYVYTLSSGVGMAVALCVLTVLVGLVTKSPAAAGLTAVLLGGAHMAWWLSAMAEVYTWSLAFLMLELLCLCCCLRQRRFVWFLAALFCNGCHFGIHNFALLNLPVYAYLFFRFFWRTPWKWGACAVVWCLGAAPVLIPIFQYASETHSVKAVLQSVLFGDYFFAKVLNLDIRNGPLWKANMALSGCSLFNPCWLFAAGGLAAPFLARRRNAQAADSASEDRSFYGVFLALTVIHFVFWFRYIVPDQATFILPTLGLLAFWAGIGAASVLKNRRFLTTACLAAALSFCGIAPVVWCWASEHFVPPRSRVLPFRNEFEYWSYPWKQNEDSAERFVAAVAEQAYPERMTAWVDTTAVAPLMAAQAMGRLPASWTWLTYWQNLPEDEIERRLRESPDGGYVLSPVRCYVPDPILKKVKSFEKKGLFYRIVW